MGSDGPFFDRTLETLPRERLNALQWERLTALARDVFPANPFVRKKWEAAGLRSASDLRSWNDFFRLPFTTKAELVDDQGAHPPFGTNLTYPLARYVRIHQTSGTPANRSAGSRPKPPGNGGLTAGVSSSAVRA